MFASRASDEVVWEAVLERFQADLDEHRRQLRLASEGAMEALDDHIVPMFVPPSHLPPLPPSLQHRAEALARETDELVAMAKDYLADHRPTPGPRRLATPASSGLSASLIDRKL